MGYLIVRLDHAEDSFLPERDRRPPITQLAKRSKLGEPPWDVVKEMLKAEGYELGDQLMVAPRTEWPITAICYTSFRKDGVGRSGSSLYRWPVRPLSELSD